MGFDVEGNLINMENYEDFGDVLGDKDVVNISL